MIMDSKRIEEILKTTAYPESVSVMLALKQVWNECEQSKKDLNNAYTKGYNDGLEAARNIT